MPSALLHQQIALLELDRRLRDAERHHRLFRRSDPDTTNHPVRVTTPTPVAAPAARVIDLPAALPSPVTPELDGHPSSPARVA